MNRIICFMLFGLFSTFLCNAENTQPVKVTGGLVSGMSEDGIQVYRGIPFAAPPVGDLRWKAPQKVIPWQGVLRAEKFGDACPQPKFGGLAMTSRQSEDCLYLNVWTPEKESSKKLPVMVWIHGGGFALGWSGEANYSGENFAKQGVVFVSIAYRLGVFGFLAHPELSAECPKGVSGNFGILDQIAALKWVRENISSFNGDPDNITIFGESAGGISVAVLCASPLAKGLFRRAISQSGGAFTPADEIQPDGGGMCSRQKAELDGVAFVKRMGVKSIAELRQLPAETLLNDPTAKMGGFWFNQDGFVIGDDPYQVYLQGKFNAVDILVGTNSNEGSLFFPPTMDPAKYRKDLQARFGRFYDAALKIYPSTNAAIAGESMRNLFRDTVFAWPSYMWVKMQSEKHNSKVYAYFFDQSQPERKFGSAVNGAEHGDEINYVFGHVGENAKFKYTDQDQAFSKMIRAAWISFATTGTPSAAGIPPWPEYQVNGDHVMYFKDFKAFLGPQPNLKQLDFLTTDYESKRKDNSK